MNFFFQRNPRRLVEQAGLPGIYGQKDEKQFLTCIETLGADQLRPLVLVIGGFMDQFLANSYAVSEQYPEDLAARHDVWFREYYEARFMRKLVHFYAGHGKPVASVGHSWGGDAAVNAVARRISDPIELLVTLDPVSRKGPPRHRLANVRHWLNIYIDYASTAWLDIPNLVARIGGPWEYASSADVNIACPSEMRHAWAAGMFYRYGEETLRERMG